MLVWNDPTYHCLIVEWYDNKVKLARVAGDAECLGATMIDIMAMLPKKTDGGVVEMCTK